MLTHTLTQRGTHSLTHSHTHTKRDTLNHPLTHAHKHSGYIDNLGVIGTLDIVFQTNKHYNKSWQHRVDKTYGANADYPVDKILSRNRGNDDDDLKLCRVDDGDVRVVSATAI